MLWKQPLSSISKQLHDVIARTADCNWFEKWLKCTDWIDITHSQVWWISHWCFLKSLLLKAKMVLHSKDRFALLYYYRPNCNHEFSKNLALFTANGPQIFWFLAAKELTALLIIYNNSNYLVMCNESWTVVTMLASLTCCFVAFKFCLSDF